MPLLAEPLDALTTAERLAVTDEWEMLMRRLPAVGRRLVAGLAQAPTEELGEPTLAAALATLLRISKTEAHRRIHDAKDLGPRAAMTGEPLEPVLTQTAAAQRRGDIGAEPAYTAKPVSNVGVVAIHNRLRVVATVSSEVDHFLLSDNSNLAAFVSQELVYAIRVCLESQVFTGENVTGILSTRASSRNRSQRMP